MVQSLNTTSGHKGREPEDPEEQEVEISKIQDEEQIERGTTSSLDPEVTNVDADNYVTISEAEQSMSDIVEAANESDSNEDIEENLEQLELELEDEVDPAGLSAEALQGDSRGPQLTLSVAGPKDISSTKDGGPVQPRNISFPTHLIGNQHRAFTPLLYEKYPWIEYSQMEDAIFCFHCRNFSENRKDPAFVSQGLRNWKRCYGTKVNDNKLLQHQTSHLHAQSVAAKAHYENVKSGNFQTIATLHDAAYSKLVKDNRHYMRVICEVLLLTAQRKIAQRETGGSFRVADINKEALDYGPSCGNFLAILGLLARHDPVVADKIRTGPKNAKYTHHSVQNAILDIMKDMVLEQIKSELNKAQYFTVLSDESKDRSKKEQLVVAVRYCYENAIHEEFIGIAEAQSLDADGLSDTIIERLQRIEANMKACVGQGYDGASVVSGHLNGVQRKLPLKTGAEMAYYVHCFCHRLNLVIVDVVKSISCVADMISLFRSLHSFLSSSTVHVRWVKVQEDHKVHVMEIGKVSDTRWSCQAKQFNVFWERLDILVEVLQDVIDTDTNPGRRTEATGYLLQIDRKFVRYLFAIRHVLNKAKFASDMLQKPSNDLSQAIDLIATLKDELDDCQSRDKIQEFWDTAEEAADRLELPEEKRPPRKRATPASLREFVVEASSEPQVASGFDGYVQNVKEILNRTTAELCKRFDEKNIKIMKGITALAPKSKSYLDPTTLVNFAELFQSEIGALRSEIATFKYMLSRKEEKHRPSTLLQLEAHLEKLNEAFFELHRLVSIACTLPVSSAECERSFSSMRLIKSDLRSLMKDERLDSLMMLGIHRARGSALDLDSVVDRFKAKFPKSRIAL
eukprot:gene17430-biopygen6363